MTALIDGYEEHLRELRRAKRTIVTYMEILTRMDRELPMGLTAACTDELQDWIFTDERGPATHNLYRVVAGGFFAWAADPDKPSPRLSYDPARKLPRVNVPRGRARPVPREQLFDIIARAEQPYRDWIVIATYLGARCCEVSALDRQHITEERTWLQGKGGRNRYVPTHPMVLELAKRLPPGPVARDHDGSRLTGRQVSNRGGHHLRRLLGRGGVSMHRFRHTYGTEVYEHCKDIRVVQELLGHASVATTQIYIGVNQQAMQRAVLGLPTAA